MLENSFGDSNSKKVRPILLGTLVQSSSRFSFSRLGNTSSRLSIIRLRLPDNGEITDDDVEAACTITTDMETFKGMYDKSVSPQAAFMTGKLKVEGDMGIALKLQSVIN